MRLGSLGPQTRLTEDSRPDFFLSKYLFLNGVNAARAGLIVALFGGMKTTTLTAFLFSIMTATSFAMPAAEKLQVGPLKLTMKQKFQVEGALGAMKVQRQRGLAQVTFHQ